MSYNRGYDLDIAGYDKNTGCISFPEAGVSAWAPFSCTTASRKIEGLRSGRICPSEHDLTALLYKCIMTIQTYNREGFLWEQ